MLVAPDICFLGATYDQAGRLNNGATYDQAGRMNGGAEYDQAGRSGPSQYDVAGRSNGVVDTIEC